MVKLANKIFLSPTDEIQILLNEQNKMIEKYNKKITKQEKIIKKLQGEMEVFKQMLCGKVDSKKQMEYANKIHSRLNKMNTIFNSHYNELKKQSLQNKNKVAEEQKKTAEGQKKDIKKLYEVLKEIRTVIIPRLVAHVEQTKELVQLDGRMQMKDSTKIHERFDEMNNSFNSQYEILRKQSLEEEKKLIEEQKKAAEEQKKAAEEQNKAAKEQKKAAQEICEVLKEMRTVIIPCLDPHVKQTKELVQLDGRMQTKDSTNITPKSIEKENKLSKKQKRASKKQKKDIKCLCEGLKDMRTMVVPRLGTDVKQSKEDAKVDSKKQIKDGKNIQKEPLKMGSVKSENIKKKCSKVK